MARKRTEKPEPTVEDAAPAEAVAVSEPAAQPEVESAPALPEPPPESADTLLESEPEPTKAPPPAEPEAEVETQAQQPPPPAAPAPARRGGALWLLLGGVAAAAVGYGLAQYMPQGWPIRDDSARFEALEARISAQEALPQLSPDVLGGLMGRLTELERGRDALASRDDLAALSERVEGLSAPFAEMEARIAALQSELSGVAAGAVGGADLEALRAVIEAERATLATQAEEIRADLAAQLATMMAEAQAQTDALAQEAERARADGVLRGAILMLQAAMDSGAELAPALQALAQAGVDVPDALQSQADGVPTLAVLSNEFPDLARDALALARAETPEDAGAGDRLWTFLMRQVGARSLAPREGDDADAVLSRAEASLRGGDLGTALATLDQLAPDVAAPFTDWRARAETRLAAQQALADLARAHGME